MATTSKMTPTRRTRNNTLHRRIGDLFEVVASKNCGVSNEWRCESLKNIATTDGECKSSNSDSDIIIVEVGVANPVLPILSPR
uniref:Uncharacterized protein n=1 Tax=Cucumis sativus TaxID=3659 RepID=A0A0A0KJL3_CUCSA